MTEFNLEKGISDLVGVFTDPIIAWPGGWMDIIPKWLKDRIQMDRLIMEMRVLHGEEPTGTDSEALAYMMPLTLEHPIDRDWTDIYLYLGTKVFPLEGKEMPADIRVEALRDDQMRDLNHFKAWLYEKRIQARLDRDRGERRQRKEEEKERKQKEQPFLFDALTFAEEKDGKEKSRVKGEEHHAHE